MAFSKSLPLSGPWLDFSIASSLNIFQDEGAEGSLFSLGFKLSLNLLNSPEEIRILDWGHTQSPRGGRRGVTHRMLKGLPSWGAGSSLSLSYTANYFSPKSIMFPCNSIRQGGSPKLSLELANYLLIAPSDFHLMNRVQMEENASHKETGAREPMNITPLDISHSSAVPVAAAQ